MFSIGAVQGTFGGGEREMSKMGENNIAILYTQGELFMFWEETFKFFQSMFFSVFCIF